MSWMTYYVEVSMRQREDEIARRIARERLQRKRMRAARGPRRHWWSLRRSAPVTSAQATRTPPTPTPTGRSADVAANRTAALSTGAGDQRPRAARDTSSAA
jgi:hypothetical protein